MRSCRLALVCAADSSLMAVSIFSYESHQGRCRCVKLWPFAVYSVKTELAKQKLYICVCCSGAFVTQGKSS